MWIIPKNLDVSACVRDMLDSNWELSELSLILEQSVMWRSKPSLARTWSQRLKRVSWMQLLSGRILRPLMADHFTRGYTSSLRVIPARANRLLAKDRARQTLDGFGRILKESLRQYNLFGSSEKMSVDILASDSPQFIEAYAIWVTKLRLACLQRRKSARLTREKDCLSWRSPAEQPAAIKTDKLVGELGKRMYHKETGRLAQYGLEQQVNWPTPKTPTGGGQGHRQTPGGGIRKLEDALVISGLLAQDSPSMNGKSQELWLTPRANETDEDPRKFSKRMGDRSPTCAGTLKAQVKTQGKLNPNWVEQLQGLPVGWTDLDF